MAKFISSNSNLQTNLHFILTSNKLNLLMNIEFLFFKNKFHIFLCAIILFFRFNCQKQFNMLTDSKHIRESSKQLIFCKISNSIFLFYFLLYKAFTEVYRNINCSFKYYKINSKILLHLIKCEK